MGQKASSTTASWSVDDWAYGTGENAIPIDEVVAEAKKMPMKYFGGKVIANDASMQQMQQDLLVIDQKFKKLLFWRKKDKSKKQDQQGEGEEQYYEEEYYDENPREVIQEEEEEQQDGQVLPPIYVNRDQGSSGWTCEVCQTRNKSSNIECERCKETNSSTF